MTDGFELSAVPSAPFWSTESASIPEGEHCVVAGSARQIFVARICSLEDAAGSKFAARVANATIGPAAIAGVTLSAEPS